MSTSLLYHAFGIRGYVQHKITFVGGDIGFEIAQPAESVVCPCCQSADIVRRGTTLRTFRSVPIGKKAVLITLPVPRVECRVCQVVRQVGIAFADPRRSYTKSFVRYALELGRRMTIQDVAQHLGVGWDLIKDLQKEYLGKRFAHIPVAHLRQIAVDEICIGHGHRYLTVVLDLQSGAIVFVGEGKGAAAVEPFFQRLRRARVKIQAVAMDMSGGYMAAVKAHLPQAKIVFDHFHVVKLCNEKLADLRRELHREAVDKLHKDVLKGTRWLLLKHPDHLDPQHDETRRLNEALLLNHSLAVAYYLKESLGQFWAQPNREAGWKFLASWYQQAIASGIRIMQQFARTLMTHLEGLLNYFDHRISTGPLEGTNNKIRVMQRNAYGYRDKEFFRLKLLALHETKLKLIG